MALIPGHLLEELSDLKFVDSGCQNQTYDDKLWMHVYNWPPRSFPQFQLNTGTPDR